MEFVSARARGIAPSPTLTIDAKTKQLIFQGVDVVNFSVGEPDFDTPDHIKSAAIEAINKGFTKYTPAVGTLDLREAICQKLKKDNGLEYSPAQIIVSNGGKHSLFNVYQVICDPGDEVILQSPYWVSYPEMIKLAEAVPVVVETTAGDGFKMTPEMIKAKLSKKTRAINLNSPSNPTGAMYSPSELEAIARLAVDNDLYIISDEIYEKLTYGGVAQISIASLGPEVKKRTITVNGLSKAYSMTGWRIGYTASEKHLADVMAALQSHSTSNPVSISQKAGVQALLGTQEPVETMRVEFKKRRDYIVERLRGIPGVSVLVPDGAFYVFPNVSAFYGQTIQGKQIKGSDDFCELLLLEGKVAVVPGSGFGSDSYVRFSYATSMERIKTGLDRIETLLRG